MENFLISLLCIDQKDNEKEQKALIEEKAFQEKIKLISKKIKRQFGDLFKYLLNYHVIGIENFYTGGNIGGAKLYKMMDYQSSYETLKLDLQNKGKTVFIIPGNQTSRKCSNCGYIYKLNENESHNDFENRSPFITGKIFVCPSCECVFDRDINAARNIRNGAIIKYFKNREMKIKNSTLWDHEKDMAINHNNIYFEAYLGIPNINPETDLWHFEEGKRKNGYLKLKKRKR